MARKYQTYKEIMKETDGHLDARIEKCPNCEDLRRKLEEARAETMQFKSLYEEVEEKETYLLRKVVDLRRQLEGAKEERDAVNEHMQTVLADILDLQARFDRLKEAAKAMLLIYECGYPESDYAAEAANDLRTALAEKEK